MKKQDSGLCTTVKVEVAVNGKVKFGNTAKFTLQSQMVTGRSELDLAISAVQDLLIVLQREADQQLVEPRSGAV